ncbi:MAG TPA: PQQ-binding-like beta-propeller repeat protein [Pilimelia sp.]|nr:PQQ-binding-like beta-propeller repeat protein [Pilimelia sp.]
MAAAVGVALLAASVVTVYRVLAPAEVVSATGAAYPAPPRATPRVIGSLAAAPLIVDNRVRVYANTRQVRADGPVNAHTQRSPNWSYRRWPQQLVGVVAAGATVVSRWSDGHLIAIDAQTGRVAWRAIGPAPEINRYAGRRTGAEVVYAPRGLFTASGGAGRTAVLASGAGELYGFDAATGRELWRTALGGHPDCRDGGFTTTGGRFVTLDACGAEPALEFYDAATGRREARWRPAGAGASLGTLPVSCAVGRSECAAMRVQGASAVQAGQAGQGARAWQGARAAQGWLFDGSRPVRAPALDSPTAWLADGIVVDCRAAEGPRGPHRAAATLAGYPARGGAPLWRRPPGAGAGASAGAGATGGRAEIVAVQPGAVHLLTEHRWLITVDPASGAELSRFDLRYRREPAELEWRPGHVYARNRFVLIERVSPDAPPEADDDEYYPIDQAVLLVGS